MTFKFRIDDAVEVYKDPLGHYHHWTILIGEVIEGTIHRADTLIVPIKDGTKLVSYVLDFVLFHKSLGNEVSVGQFNHPIGMMTWRPAVHKEDVQLDVAVDCSLEEFKTMTLETLVHNPSRLLHNRGPKAEHTNCYDCLQTLKYSVEVEQTLSMLADSSDPYMSQRAQDLIERLTNHTI